MSVENRTAPLSSEPETDQQNQDKRGQNEPRNHDDFDSQFARGRNVIIDVRIDVKESVTVTKNVHADLLCYFFLKLSRIEISGILISRVRSVAVSVLPIGPRPVRSNRNRTVE